MLGDLAVSSDSQSPMRVALPDTPRRPPRRYRRPGPAMIGLRRSAVEKRCNHCMVRATSGDVGRSHRGTPRTFSSTGCPALISISELRLSSSKSRAQYCHTCEAVRNPAINAATAITIIQKVMAGSLHKRFEAALTINAVARGRRSRSQLTAQPQQCGLHAVTGTVEVFGGNLPRTPRAPHHRLCRPPSKHCRSSRSFRGQRRDRHEPGPRDDCLPLLREQEQRQAQRCGLVR